MSLDLQSKNICLAGILDNGTLVVIMGILSLVDERSGLANKIRLLWSANYQVNLRVEVIESVC